MFAAALVALLLSPSADLNEAAKKELKQLEGDWVIVSVATEGKERELPKQAQQAVTIKGTKFSHETFGDGEVTALDTSTSPKLIDFVMRRKPESGFTNEGIYKIEKDTLTIVVYIGEDKKRPASFDVPKDTHTVRWTLKRVKEQK
ncbi:MAG: TIGR03067 domain-containing protein [Planctomycetia bacterium]|nr:TIGR03067 domain-containing protein [Planctomycetia bacterium]